MWIMLTDKLPTVVSPPKLGIFWSVPWPNIRITKRIMTIDSGVLGGEPFVEMGEVTPGELYPGENQFNLEQWSGARKIRYKGEDIRVFPREFNPVSVEFMQEMIDGGAHELVTTNAAEQELIKRTLGKGQRQIFDAALMDGCNKAQATATALGQDVTLPDWNFPPIGWYRCIPQYAGYFCYESEMKG